jgi:hypothetical protein
MSKKKLRLRFVLWRRLSEKQHGEDDAGPNEERNLRRFEDARGAVRRAWGHYIDLDGGRGHYHNAKGKIFFIFFYLNHAY